MTDNLFNIFKVTYSWYEGEYEECLLGKKVSIDEFEKDLTTAKDFAESLIGTEIKDHDYLGKGYSVECLPQFYEQILWYLTNKQGYIVCSFNPNIEYDVDDGLHKDKISVIKNKKEINHSELD